MTPTNRKKVKKKFLEDMLHLSSRITEKDRKEILKEIKQNRAEETHAAYTIILDYLADNKDVDFNVNDYRKILDQLIERNKNKSVYKLRSNLADEFKESLFARCNLDSGTFGVEVNENQENTNPPNGLSSPNETQQGVNDE